MVSPCCAESFAQKALRQVLGLRLTGYGFRRVGFQSRVALGFQGLGFEFQGLVFHGSVV